MPQPPHQTPPTAQPDTIEVPVVLAGPAPNSIATAPPGVSLDPSAPDPSSRGQTYAYGRVSSFDQADTQQAAAQQRDCLIQAHPDRILFDIESGASTTRPAFQQLMAAIQQGLVATVIATRWDRLTRNLDDYKKLKQELQAAGVRLHLLHQGDADFETACGELNADMQVLLAIHERRMLQERIRKGNIYRRKRQVAWTRAPWGYIIINDQYQLDTRPLICHLSDRPDQYAALASAPDDSPHLCQRSRADIAREALACLLAGQRPHHVLRDLYTRYGIAPKAFVPVAAPALPVETTRPRHQKRTNLVLAAELLFWSSGRNLAAWAANPVLRGHTAYRKCDSQGRRKPATEWELHRDTHPDQCLLSEAEFQTLQQHQAAPAIPAPHRAIPPGRFYLTGYVYCAACGYKMVLKNSPAHRYYGCRKSTTGCGNRRCIRVERLDAAIAQHCCQRAAQLGAMPVPGPSAETPAVSTLRAQLAAIEQTLARYPNPILQRAQHELQQDLEQLTTQASQTQLATLTAHQILSHPAAADLSFWYTRSNAERAQLYAKLLHRITVQAGVVVRIELTV